MVIIGAEDLCDSLAHGDGAGRVEEYLGGFVHFGYGELCVQHEHALVDEVELGGQKVVVGEDALQIFHVEEHGANQTAHVP